VLGQCDGGILSDAPGTCGDGGELGEDEVGFVPAANRKQAAAVRMNQEVAA